MRSLLLATAAIAVSAPALAAIDAAPCAPAPEGDPRVRCVQFNPSQVVRIPARVGSHVTILFAEDSTILDPASARVETLTRTAEGQPVKPTEWQGVWDGNSMQLMALNSSLPPTAMTVPVRMRSGRVLPHLFQLDARDDNRGRGARLLTADDEPDEKKRQALNDDTIIMVRFTYTAQQDPPVAPPAPPPRPQLSASAISAAAEERSVMRSGRIAGQLRQEAFYGQNPRNWSYVARGDRETEPLEVSDNGLDTVLRFDPALVMPNIYKTDNGKCDGEAEALVTRDNLGPGLVRVHGSYPVLCLRRSADKATEMRNLGFNPYGSNPGTGTISPNVVRTVRRAPRS